MYSNDTPSRSSGHGTLPNRELPPVVAKATKEIPVTRDWNAESDRIYGEMFGKDFDTEYESNKPHNILNFLDERADQRALYGMNARGKIEYFKRNFPDVASQPGYSMHPITEQWAVENIGKPRSQNFMEWANDQVLARQYPLPPKKVKKYNMYDDPDLRGGFDDPYSY